MGPRDESFAASREALSRAMHDALAEAEAAADSDTVYRQASWLVDVLTASMNAAGRMRADAARRIKEENGLSFSQLGERLGVSKARAADMLRVTQTRQPELPPVVTALVTSDLGVLAGRRKSKKPVWAFVGDQQQPGESVGEAAARAISDQVGLKIIPGRLVARQPDPDGGPATVYIAARPADSKQLDVKSADHAQWAELRWLALADAEELLPDMSAPVQAYLSRALRPRFSP